MTNQQRDQAVYMGVFGPRQLTLTHGQGCLLYDDAGREYVDFLAGIAVNALGYNHPAWVQAVTQQATCAAHVSNYFYTQPQLQLAERLTAACGMQKVFFANSGAEAVEGAIKLARRYGATAFDTPRTKIVSLQDSFHGRTLATLAATGQPKYQTPFAPLPQGFVQVPGGDLAALEAQLADAVAFLVEPIQGESGVQTFTPEYWQGVKQLMAKYGTLLIADEVQTGIGRTGHLLASQALGLQPDIITLAKALGGGVPIGAVLCNARADVFERGQHGSTFGGNPLCCAAANAVLDVVLQPGFMQGVQQRGEQLAAGLSALVQKYPNKALEARGMGLMRGLQLAESVSGAQVVAQMLQAGFIINCAGHNTLRFVPPLIIAPEQIDAMLAALDGVLAGL